MLNTKLLGSACLLAISAFAQQLVPLVGHEGLRLNHDQVAVRQQQASRKRTDNKAVIFPGDTVIAHIVDGGGWSSAVTLTNLDTRRLTVTLLFFADNGTDLILPVNGSGPVRGMELALDPMTSLTFETSGTSAGTKSGWVYMMKGIDDAIGGFCIFRQRTFGRADFEAVVPITNEFDNHAVLIYDNLNGFATAAAFANPDKNPMDINFIVRAENGTVLERKTIRLDGYTHTAGTIAATFPSTAGRRGTLEFTTSGYGAGVIGLRFNPSGAFTSFNVLSNFNW
jgi:hypothetical protein